VAVSAVFFAADSVNFILLISLAGPIFSYLVLETRQGGFLAPVPAVCWSAMVFGGILPAAVITAGTLLTGILCHWKNRSLRNMFISYIPAILLIMTAGRTVLENPSSILYLLPAGAILQISSQTILEGFKSRVAAVTAVFLKTVFPVLCLLCVFSFCLHLLLPGQEVSSSSSQAELELFLFRTD